MKFPSRIGTDEKGYVLKFASRENITTEYIPIVEEIVEIVRMSIKDKLHSIYIYGSVGRGKAVLGKSDVDICIIVKSKLTGDEDERVREDKNKFLQKREDIPKVDLEIATLEEVMDPENLYEWGFWMKHICGCLHGEDLGEKIPKMKPSRAIAKRYSNDTIKTLESHMEKAKGENFTTSDMLSPLKRVIRGAFFLVSEEDESWAVEKGDILEILGHYFPDEQYFGEIGEVISGKKELSLERYKEILGYFIEWFKMREIS